MCLRSLAAACMTITFALGTQPATAMPIQTIACTPSADGSSIQIIATADGSERKTCVFSCHIKLTGQSRFQGYKCQATVDAKAGEQLLCELEGDGPNTYSEARFDRFDC